LTTEKIRQQVRESVAKLRQRRREAGLVRQDVWAKPEDWPKIREIEAKLKAERMKDE
jgi:hypothetical protein